MSCSIGLKQICFASYNNIKHLENALRVLKFYRQLLQLRQLAYLKTHGLLSQKFRCVESCDFLNFSDVSKLTPLTRRNNFKSSYVFIKVIYICQFFPPLLVYSYFTKRFLLFKNAYSLRILLSLQQPCAFDTARYLKHLKNLKI